MKYFTSDWHLGHTNMVTKFGRPFETIEEMDDTIINNAFSGKKRGDIIYFLGDLYLQDKSFKKMFYQIPDGVRFIWILGNHDQKNYRKHLNQIETIVPMMETKIGSISTTLCHYPMLSWNKSHHGSYQLFGHHHVGGQPIKVTDRQLNVNVEFHDYKMWSEDEVIEYMNGRR